jgi:hypothetical protein
VFAGLRPAPGRGSVSAFAASRHSSNLAGPNDDTSARGTDGVPRSLLAETERIAAALEPELRRVVDVTLERVAAVEQQTLREARALMAASEHDSLDALERSNRLVQGLEALTGTVSEATARLQAEADEVTAALRGLSGSPVSLPTEMLPPRPAQPREEVQPAPEPEPEVAEPEADAQLDLPAAEPAEDPAPAVAPAPEPPAAERAPDPEIELSPELTTMFRNQITRMRDDGKSKDEAERVLLRFRLGHHYLAMLDDIYLSEPSRRSRSGRRRLLGRRRSE